MGKTNEGIDMDLIIVTLQFIGLIAILLIVKEIGKWVLDKLGIRGYTHRL